MLPTRSSIRIYVLVTLLSLLSESTLSSAAWAASGSVSALKGVVDMGSNADRAGVTTLDGDWWYNWQKLLPPQPPLSAADGLYTMPSTWDVEQKNFKMQPGQGYATFRLSLVNIPNDKFWGIAVPEQSTAFRLYLDDRILAEGGKVANNRSDAEAYRGIQVIKIGRLADSAQLTLQVSNFHHNSGGPWQAISIGPYHELNRRYLRSIFDQTLVIALTLIACLFLLVQWVIDRRELSSLLLSGFALVVAIRLGVVDHQPLYEIFAAPTWDVHSRLAYISMLLVFPLIISWMHRVYPLDFSHGLTVFIIVAFVSAALFVGLSDPLVFTALLPWFLVLMTLTMLYAIYGVTRTVIHRRQGGMSIAIGTAVLCACVGNDMMIHSQWIQSTTFLSSSGTLAFLLSLMINLIYLRAKEKEQVEALSQELRQINRKLEFRVEQRTQEIAEKAVALENANEKLLVLANVDGLTQVFNRRAFIEQCEVFAKVQAMVAMVLIDVDHFKQVNDNYGHTMGDEALVRLAFMLEQSKRPNDRVGRFGGEEFVILLHDITTEAVDSYCARVVENARQIDFSDCGDFSGISVSVGAAIGLLTPHYVDLLLQQADIAMYHVKNNGRDGHHVTTLE